MSIRPVQPAMPEAEQRSGSLDPVSQHPGKDADQDAGQDAGTAAGRAHGSPGRARLVLALAGIVLLALNLRGAVTTVPPLLDRFRDELAMSTTVVGVLGSLPTLAFAAAGWVGARLLRRMPAERIAVGVLVVAAAGQLARPWSGSALAFLAISGTTLLAMGIGNVILPPLVKAWFPHRIGAVTSAYVATIATGTAVPALIAVPLADAAGADGWRVGLATWAAIAVIGLPAWLVLARTPRAIPADRTLGHVRIPLYRSKIARGLALMFAMTGLNTYALLTWLPARLTDAGLSDAAAGAQLALFAGIGAIPALIVPLVAVRVRRPELLVAACVACFLVGYLGLLLAPATLTTLWVLITGLGPSTFPLSLTLVGLRSASPATAGALSGFTQGIGYLAAAAGPILVGVLHDATGGWPAPFAFLGVSLALLMLGGIWCAPARTVDDDVRVPGGPTGTDTLVG
jgi:MFS transporter, CP family, cyanate transporter